MSIRLSQQDETNGILQIRAEGRLIGSDFDPQSANPLDELLGPGWQHRRIALDLSEASFIDSSALGWLLLCKKRLDAGGGRMVLHSAPQPIQEVFRMMRMQKVLPLFEDQAQALDFLIESSPASPSS